MKNIFTKDKLKDIFSDLKDFYQKSKVLFYILFGFLIFFWLFYAWNFSSGLSNDQSIWAEFGDFFNGVVSPIFAAINICIFWYLTKAVEDSNNKRQDEIDANEDRRRQQDAEHQKALILMQFRKNEIDKLNEVLQVSNENTQNANYLLLLIHWGLTVDNFLKSKLVFFGLEKNTMIAKNLQTLHNEFSVISNEYMTWQLYYSSFNNLYNKPDAVNREVNLQALLAIIMKCNDELSKHLNTAMELKTSIINELQKITLGEQSKTA